MARIGFAERLAQHRRAVLALAHQSAKRAVKRQFQAQGVRLHDLSARQITIWAQAWFDAHSAELIAEDKHNIATWPGFERWREPYGPLAPPVYESDHAKPAIDLTR